MLRGTRGGKRWRGLASVGWVMDNREPYRWTGASPQLDNPHWSGSVNNGFKHTFSGGFTVRSNEVVGEMVVHPLSCR